jgi:nucleoside-diphosphate-sugar epimerase
MSDKKILVTGADGFIGSHLVEQLVSAGFVVKALVQYNSFSSWGWLESSGVIQDIEVVMGDIRDSDQMRKCNNTWAIIAPEFK